MPHPRQQDLDKLLKYARGLGVKVTFLPYERGHPTKGIPASYNSDDKAITITMRKRKTKTDTILDLLHELGHHLDWLHRGKEYRKALDDALYKEYKDMSIAERELILKDEESGTAFMTKIAIEVDIKMKLSRIKENAKPIHMTLLLKKAAPMRPPSSCSSISMGTCTSG